MGSPRTRFILVDLRMLGCTHMHGDPRSALQFSGVFVGVYVCADTHVLVLDGLMERERHAFAFYLC